MYRALSTTLGAALIICVGLALTAPVRAVAPVCDISGPSGGGPDQVLVFDASGSYDSDGTIVSYVWSYPGGVVQNSGSWRQRYDGRYFPCYNEANTPPRINPAAWDCGGSCPDNDWSWEGNADQTTARAIEIVPQDLPPPDPPYPADCQLTSANCAWHIEDTDCSGCKYKYRASVPAAPSGATVLQRVRFVDSPGDNNAIIARIGTGAYRVELYATNDDSDPLGQAMMVHNYRVQAPDPEYFGAGTFNKNEWHIFRVTCDSGGNFALYLDEDTTPIGTGSAQSGGTYDSYQFGAANSGNTAIFDVDWYTYSIEGAYPPGQGPGLPWMLYVSYPTDGSYEVCVIVTDDEALTATCCQTVDIGNHPPTCSISYDLANPAPGQTITFNANASDPDGHAIASYAWDFGDTGTASGDPATHVYAAEATYTVSCTVTDEFGASGVCSTEVVVENLPPTCAITYAPANPVTGETVTFNANAADPNGQAITSYAWDFGDGGTGTGDPATHAYATGGTTYTVTCTVTDEGGASNTCTTDVYVNTPPTCAIEVTSGSPYRTCYPICFSGAGSSDPDGTVVSYAWTFGDGAPAAVTVPNGTFDDETMWTRYGDAEGEGGISTLLPYCAFDQNPTGNFFGRASNGMAIEDHIYQTVSGVVPYGVYRASMTIGTYSDVDPGLVSARIGVDPIGGTDPAAPSVVWAEGRNNGCPPSPISMGVDFQAGCGTVMTLFLEIEGPPGNGWNIVAIDTVLLTGQTTASGVEVCHAYQSAGSYTVTLTVTDDLGATSTCTTEVVVSAGVCCSVEVSPSDAHICETISFSATATGGTAPYTYAWDFGDGGTDTGQAVTHVYNISDTYVVQCVATDNAGVSGLCCATVQVAGALPVCVIEGPSKVTPGTIACWNGYQSYDPDDCGGCGTSCPGVGIVSYAWDFGGGGSNLVINADFEGLYTAGVADSWTSQEVAGSGIFWGDWMTFPYGPANESGPHGGSNCQFVQFSGGVSADIRLYQVVSGLTIGEVYTVGGWIAMDDPGVADSAVQIGYDLNAGTNFTWSAALAADGYWHQGTETVVATGTSLSIAYRWYNTTVPDAAGSYYCYADDATVAGVASEPTGCHTYTTLGTETVSLTVTDDEGDTSTCTMEVTVTDQPLPTCSITYSPTDPTVLDMITFNGNSQPSQGGGSIVSSAWSFGDGWGASGDPVTHMYADNGVYTVTLYVTDNLGEVGYCSAKVTVANMSPICQIVAPSSGAPGEEICFDGTSSSDPDGTIVSYLWDFGGMGTPPDLTVTNPGFDDDTPPSYPGWTVYGTASGDADFTFCSYAARSAPYFFGAASSYGNASRRAYQVLSGAVPGGTYLASVWINSVSFDPGTPDVPYPTNMHTRVGIDPEGGTDPAAGTVVWSDDTSNMICGPGPYEEKTVQFTATTATPTVFVEGWNDATHGWQIFAMDDVSIAGVSTSAGTGPQPCHTYASEGSYTVTLTVTDDDGGSSSCTHSIDIYETPPTVEVTIPLSQGWHMMSLPLEPVNKTVLVDRTTKVEDPDSIFYSAYVQGNDPRNRLFRMEPGVGYWVYNPDLYPTESWYEVGVEPPVGKPHPGPWWQGFWFYVEPTEGITLTYVAYPLPTDPMVRYLDINKNYTPGTFTWAWMMTGACARVSEPYASDVTTWPLTSIVTDMMWGNSCTGEPPTVWLPTSDCAGDDAWDQGKIGLPVVGYTPGVGYYTLSPPSGQPYCGAPADTQYLTPGEGYWLDVEDPCVWLRLLANQWP